jgi:DNA-binding response OmpR family regulator
MLLARDRALSEIARLSIQRLAHFEMLTVTSEQQAQTLATNSRPALIMVDAESAEPGAAYRVASWAASTPILLLTIDDDLTDAPPAGVSAVIGKPFDPRLLAREVKSRVC